MAERNGDTWLALRARNNVLGAASGEDALAAAQIVADGYAIAERHGIMTWAFQFAHLAEGGSLETGDWDKWTDVVNEMDAPGFYGGWRKAEAAVRHAYRGHLDEARTSLEEARALTGTESTQAASGMDATESIIEFVAGNWARMFELAQRSWIMGDSFDYSAAPIAAGISAAGNSEWARAELAAFTQFVRRGTQQRALRAHLEAVVAMLEGRWSDARASFRDAERDLRASHYNMELALLQLAVGTRGAGHMPESEQALAEAKEFFAKVGATSFVDNYQIAMVAPERAARAATDAVPNAAR
jgi:hypothetical protein